MRAPNINASLQIKCMIKSKPKQTVYHPNIILKLASRALILG